MSRLTQQDPHFIYVPAASTDVEVLFVREWERLGHNPPNLDPKVQRNRLRAQGFDSLMEHRDAAMRRILDRVESGLTQPGDVVAIRNYVGL